MACQNCQLERIYRLFEEKKKRETAEAQVKRAAKGAETKVEAPAVEETAKAEEETAVKAETPKTKKKATAKTAVETQEDK